jgi:dihydrolipoamide dehydrogenase
MRVEVEDTDGNKKNYTAQNIILATGARSKELPNLKQDGKKIIGYREAMTLDKLPASMVVVGSGAIGSEFANFYQSLGTTVTLVEFLPRIVPVEDEEVSKQLERSFKKIGMKVMTGSTVESVDNSKNNCLVTIKTPKDRRSWKLKLSFPLLALQQILKILVLRKQALKPKMVKLLLMIFTRHQYPVFLLSAILFMDRHLPMWHQPKG